MRIIVWIRRKREFTYQDWTSEMWMAACEGEWFYAEYVSRHWQFVRHI